MRKIERNINPFFNEEERETFVRGGKDGQK